MKLDPHRRILTAAALSTLLFGSCAFAQTSSWPTRPIKVVVPFAPGGNADSTARIFTEAMTKTLGQPMIVDNRPGAGGMIGAAQVARAEADGYTLLCATPGPILSSWQLAGARATYGVKDLRAVALLTTVPNVFVVSASSPIKTFADLVAFASTPGKVVKFGHTGNATTTHVNALQLQKALNTEFTLAPYKGSAPAVQDILGGHLDVLVTDIPPALQLVKTGKLRALAVVSAQRISALPDVPTMEQLKLGQVNATNFTALMAPRDTPDSVVAKLASSAASALSSPEVLAKIEALGTTPGALSADAFASFLQREEATYAALVKSGLLQPE